MLTEPLETRETRSECGPGDTGSSEALNCAIQEGEFQSETCCMGKRL